MKQLIVALFAGTLALSSMSALAAEPAGEQSTAGTKTEKTKEYVKKKTRSAKEKTRKAGKKVKKTIAERKTTDPASPSESQPAAPSK